MFYVGELRRNGVLYHTFYDKDTKLLRFFSNGKEVEDDHLSNTYNKSKHSLSGYGRLTTLIISLSIITASIGVTALDRGYDFHGEQPIVIEQQVDVEHSHELTGEELYNALLEANPDVKEYIEMTKDVLLEYGQYMNQDELLDSIKSFEVVETSNREEIASGEALAFYTGDENRIYIDDQLTVDSIKRTCLYHEFLHYYSQSGLYDYNTYGSGYIGYALNEGFTEMLNSEFNDDELFTYHKEAAYVGAICEIIGPEAFERAYFGNSIEMLIDEISKYCSYEDAIALVKNIDNSKAAYESFVINDNDEDYANFVSSNVNAWDIISMMYENKYDRDITEDNLMNAYKSASTLENYSDFDLGDNGFLVDVVVNKHYFVKPESDYIIVDYNVKDDYGMQGDYITIDESNRYVNKNSAIKK